jgi:predicted acylesterase/phospholipase RssA
VAQGSAPPRETRLALVMNGGVSLAVWMGGVSAEIDRLRRAGREPSGEDGALRLWDELVSALDVRVTVDVIAGTSAGGLNGAALATSIARGTQLPDLRQTWLDVASIGRLAGGEDQPNDAERQSVLNGEMFAVAIRDVFGRVAGPERAAAEIEGLTEESVDALETALAEEARSPRAVVLYTTATSLRGKPTTYADETGLRFGQLEYRIVCRFRRDLRGHDEFAGAEATDRLSRAARASASFPVAFQPTFFRAPAATGDAGPGGEGPGMAAISNMGDQSRWVIDGGVLDNEPFGPVLDEVARRPVDADVDRVVAYVVPEGGLVKADPDSFDHKQGMIGPTMAALSLPREVNLANQLDRLRQMERDARACRDDDRELFDRAAGGRLDGAVEELFDQYRAWRLAAAVWEARTVAAETREATVQMLSAPAEMGDGDAGGIRDWLPTGDDVGLADRWRWGPSAAERVLRLAMSLARGAAREHPGDSKISRALVALSAAVWELQEQRRSAHEALRRRIGGAQLSDRQVLAALDAHYASPEAREQETAIVRTLRFALDRSAGDAEKFAAAALKVEVVRRAAAATDPYTPTPRFRFYRFGANCGSPLVGDGEPPDNKLLGLRVGHFGGFLDRSWRAYDWAWGRMDGATQLVGMLTNPRALQARFGETAGDLGDADANKALADLRLDWSDADALKRLRAALVKRFHRAILADEMPTIVAAMGDAAPEGDGDDPARFNAIVAAIPDVSVEDLRTSEGGRETTSRLVADGLTALSADPKLPLRSHLDDALRAAAKAELGYEHVRGWLHHLVHRGGG